VWGKLVVNAAINPLTALLRVPNGELLATPSTRALMGVIAQETAKVARSIGIDLPYPDPIEMVRAVARRTASNYSSMLKDVMRGSPTEVDSINGAIVRTGETTQMPVEVNRTLWMLVKALEPGQNLDLEIMKVSKPYRGAAAKGIPAHPKRQPVRITD
jgi:2-dehydropantoate 2-reductase